MPKALKDNVRPFRWTGTAGVRRLLILDQLLLPHRVIWISCRTHLDVARCIREMNVRGAPAIGCVAAYGFALAAYEKKFRNWKEAQSHFAKVSKTLGATRPTAVNLFWALERMSAFLARLSNVERTGKDLNVVLRRTLEKEADAIYREDLAANHRMGELGAGLLPKNAVVLTHCNAGSLATSGWGTALGVIRAAYEQGKIKKVFVDETRPYLQGARLTAWELDQDKIPHELITDNMAAHLMKTEKIDAVIVGSDRIAANGDVANKIGTYGLAVLCKYHNIPFYVAAPVSTCDPNIASGKHIPIEERSSREVTHIRNLALSHGNVRARHPAFDVTPHALVTAIVTEKGIAQPPSPESVKKLLNGSSSRSLSI